MSVKPYTLFTGDNLPVMRGLDSESVDLIYLDPPFNKNKDFMAPIGHGEKKEDAGFKDWWVMDDVKEEDIGEIAKESPPTAELINTAGKIGERGAQPYLIVMAVRLMEMKRLLKPTGSLYLHCDQTMSHWLKLLLDSIFSGGGGVSKTRSFGTTASGLTSRTTFSGTTTPSCSTLKVLITHSTRYITKRKKASRFTPIKFRAKDKC